jgi:hypothetical protein
MKTLSILAAVLLASGACSGSPAAAGMNPGMTTTWQIGFVPWPGLNVAACWAPGLAGQPRFCAEVVNVNSTGAFHEVWDPPQPNTLRVDGTMTSTTFSATLQCASTGTGSGAMAATWTGSEYDGTATLNGQSVMIWVREGSDTSACNH